jgi:hypothetical protein
VALAALGCYRLLNRPRVVGDFWPWRIKDVVYALRAHSRQADDPAVFG